MNDINVFVILFLIFSIICVFYLQVEEQMSNIIRQNTNIERSKCRKMCSKLNQKKANPKKVNPKKVKERFENSRDSRDLQDSRDPQDFGDPQDKYIPSRADRFRKLYPNAVSPLPLIQQNLDPSGVIPQNYYEYGHYEEPENIGKFQITRNKPDKYGPHSVNHFFNTI